jgi:hypothetical protein
MRAPTNFVVSSCTAKSGSFQSVPMALVSVILLKGWVSLVPRFSRMKFCIKRVV